MIRATLRLIHAPEPLREAAGWLIPGADAAGWLDELCAWQVGLADAALYIVPRSFDDRRPQGLFVVPQAEAAARVSPRCRPYGCVAGRLYVPVEAAFDPAVTEAELSGRLGEGEWLFHPATGLVRFEAADCLRIADLLAPPIERRASWDRAEPGMAIARRLSAVLPERLPSVELILDEGRDDIGDHAQGLDELPPLPDEPGGASQALDEMGRQAKRQVARVVQWLTSFAPRTATEPTWVSKLEDWAQRQLGRAVGAMNPQRQRELMRLLKLLESDPDKGLRYALPLGSDGGFRGIAPPSGRLGEREPQFDLSRLGHSGPADPWAVDAAIHGRLVERYRDLANREIRLGRHRRAAYILAELLRDSEAPASTLEAGGHFREAAILFRDRLKRPLAAAACLERAGLLTEAIEIYDELNEFERSGDLYMRLERPDRASEAFRRAVAGRLEGGDPLAAARLLERKLDAPLEALDVLDAGWPISSQAGPCLREAFRLRGKLGRHEEAADRIAALRSGALSDNRTASLLDMLAEAATNYPDPVVRANAGDSARVVAAKSLADALPSDAERFLGAIRRLVPGDRLLDRDCRRYVEKRRATARPVPPARARAQPGWTLKLSWRIELPMGVDWKAAAASRSGSFIAGVVTDRLCVYRLKWTRELTVLICPNWKLDRVIQHTVLLAVDSADSHLTHVFVLGNKPLERFSSSDQSGKSIAAGSPPTAPSGTVAMARGTNGQYWLLALVDSGFVLYGYDAQDRLLSSYPLRPSDDWLDPEVEPTLPSLHAREGAVFVGIGRRLMILTAEGRFDELLLPQPILGLAGAPIFSRTRVAASLLDGGAIIWRDVGGWTVERFAHELASPTVGFTKGGQLVAAGEGACQVYTTLGGKLKLDVDCRLDGVKPIAVLPTDQRMQTAFVRPNGTIEVYDLVRGGP